MSKLFEQAKPEPVVAPYKQMPTKRPRQLAWPKKVAKCACSSEESTCKKPQRPTLSVLFCSAGKTSCLQSKVDHEFRVTRFHEPENQARRLHDGRHPHIQKALMQNEHWPDLVRDVRFQIEQAESKGATHLALAFRCRGGKHRSVACATLFAAVASATGRDVSLFHAEFPRRACKFWGCNVCHKGHWPTTECVAEALKTWVSVKACSA